MHDPWTDRLSEYIDGELSAADAAAVQRHLQSCDACARLHAELLEVTAAARTLEDSPPQRDLWSGIAARIGAPALPTTADVVPLPLPRRGAPRRFVLSLPQLAAAAVVLMSLSGGAAWLLGTRTAEPPLASGTLVQSAGGAARDTRLIAAPPAEPSPSYDTDVAELERMLQEQRERLDPQTVEVIERSIESIDNAIAQARTALAADPGNPYLHKQLDTTMRKKLDILRRATRIHRAGS